MREQAFCVLSFADARQASWKRSCRVARVIGHVWIILVLDAEVRCALQEFWFGIRLGKAGPQGLKPGQSFEVYVGAEARTLQTEASILQTEAVTSQSEPPILRTDSRRVLSGQAGVVIVRAGFRYWALEGFHLWQLKIRRHGSANRL
jgi:hypothetical protein